MHYTLSLSLSGSLWLRIQKIFNVLLHFTRHIQQKRWSMLPTCSAIGYCLFIPCLQARAPSYVLKWVSKQLRRKGLLAGDWRSVSRGGKILIWYTTVVMKQLSWLVGLRALWIPKMHQGQYIIGCSRTWKLWRKKWLCHVWNYFYKLVMGCRFHFHYSRLNCCCVGRRRKQGKIKEGIER